MLPGTYLYIQGYVTYRTEAAPAIDGRMDEAAWRLAPWSDYFEDIVGPIVSMHSMHGPRGAT